MLGLVTCGEGNPEGSQKFLQNREMGVIYVFLVCICSFV